MIRHQNTEINPKTNTTSDFDENSPKHSGSFPPGETLRILMIDDHPSQIEGYKVILSYNTLALDIDAMPCYSSQKAFEILLSKNQDFDIIFIDRNLPAYPEENIFSGEDLALVIKKHLPFSKIVMITSHSEAFILYNIVKKIDPAGLLVKSDFTAQDLLVAFEHIVNGEVYYSQTVKESIARMLSKESYLDTYNRQIIMLLSQGIKTKNLPDYLKISLSAVEKRKAQVKDYLCIDKGTDEDIVREAKRLGFI